MFAFVFAAACGNADAPCPERLTTTTERLDLGANGTVEMRSTTTTTYFADGRRRDQVEEREEDGSGQGTYASTGKVTTVWMYAGSAAPTGAIVDHEDMQGLVRRVVQTYTYDAAGRLAEIHEEADDAPLDGVPDARATEMRIYDALGRLAQRTIEVDGDADGTIDGRLTDDWVYEGEALRHKSRGVTADDYEPLVTGGLPPVYRATVTPRYDAVERLIGNATEIDFDDNGLTDALQQDERTYEPDCP